MPSPQKILPSPRKSSENALYDVPGNSLNSAANSRYPLKSSMRSEIVTVSELDEKGRIHLDDGRIVPATFKQFAHGYAVTAHRSQGKSVDSVIMSGDGMQKELFYVAASRGKSEIFVVTSDKERLRESVASSTARLSASELIRKCRAQVQQGMRRGRAMACKLAMLAARQQPDFDHIKQRKVERKNEHNISR